MGQLRCACEGQVQDPSPGRRYILHDNTVLPIQSRIWTGSGGLSVSQQLYNRFYAAGKPLKAGDIAIVDAAEYHNYQVCVSYNNTRSPPSDPVLSVYSLDGTSDP